MLAKISELFATSDANGDGRLNREEYLAFMAVQMENAREDGAWVEPMPSLFTRSYDMYNTMSEEEGVDYNQFLACSGKYYEYFEEYKGADEAAAAGQ
mmetsp:Transcript_17389/g.21958  ORF Transcript_17389/g.21958 Transcript_17389/m.21958 type:complete len:97 (+) Transcript_17389:211-501(+)